MARHVVMFASAAILLLLVAAPVVKASTIEAAAQGLDVDNDYQDGSGDLAEMDGQESATLDRVFRKLDEVMQTNNTNSTNSTNPTDYPPPAPPPPGDNTVPVDLDGANALTSTGSVLAVPSTVIFSLNDAGCARAKSDGRALFIYLYRVATGTGWNNSAAGQVNGQTVFAADTTAGTLNFTCGNAGASTITVTGTLTNVPPTVTAEKANENKDSFKTALVTSYTDTSSRRRRSLLGRAGMELVHGSRRGLLVTSSFASEFGVTGATVTVQDAVSTAAAAEEDNNLALGLGLGLGLGIPFLACCIIAVVLIMRRRKAQAVGQSSGDDGAEADEEK